MKEKKNEYISELRGLLRRTIGENKTIDILSVPVYLLAIDKRYQTDIRTKRNLSYLVDNWDERKLLPLIGVPHMEEGLIYLVDGYGRLNASQIVDREKYKEMTVMVIMNAPKDEDERLKFEAEQYAFQNKDVAKVTPIQKHAALEIIGDSRVKLLNKMQKKYNFLLASVSGQRNHSVIGSYSQVLDYCKYKEECLDFIFGTLQKGGFNYKVNGYASYVIKSLKDIYFNFKDYDRDKISDIIGNFFRGIEVNYLRAESTVRYPLLTTKMAVSMYLEDYIVHELHITHSRKAIGDKVISLMA